MAETEREGEVETDLLDTISFSKLFMNTQDRFKWR